MKLTFLGTRGNIDARNRRHRRHAAALVEYRGTRLMVDCGEDWLGRFEDLEPDAIIVTHAHPDHALGLKQGAPCPVHAPRATHRRIEDFPVQDRRRVRLREPFRVGGIEVEAFGLEHSTRAPAVGFRISAGRARVFYVPDVVSIWRRAEALAGIRLFVGDGATIERSMVRKPGRRLVGHTPIRTQLGWCRDEGVSRALFTHCGTGIVDSDERRTGAKVRALGRERGVEAAIARDGQEEVLR